MKDVWASDVPVSRPQGADPHVPVQVSFGGFGFSANGIVHDLNESDVEDVFTPTFAPEGFRG